MSVPHTGEKVLGATATRRATRMVAWSGADSRRLEAARVVLSGRGVRATGSMVCAQRDGIEAYSASYALTTDEAGVVQRLTVRTTRAQGEQHVTLTRSEEGIWLVDHGQGAARNNFGGALDVDLAFSPLFNALPVRRLSLHRDAAQHDLPVVFVALPSLEVCRVSQIYRTVSLGDPSVAGLPAVIGLSAPPTVSHGSGDSFDVEFTVDVDGLVVDYPGLARRT